MRDIPVGELEPDEVGAAAAACPLGGLLERPRALFVLASAPFRHVAQQSEGVHAEVAVEQGPRDREGGVRTPTLKVGVDGVLDGHNGGSRPPGDVHAALGDGSVQPREDVSRPSGVTQPAEDLPVVRAVTSGQQGDRLVDVAVVVGQFQQHAVDLAAIGAAAGPPPPKVATLAR